MLVLWIWLIIGAVFFLVIGLPAIDQAKDDQPVANELSILYLLLSVFWPIVLVGGLVSFVAIKVIDYRNSRKPQATDGH